MLIEKKSLYIVATPIGNLGDMTYRAVEVLSSVDLIAAEDTRHTAQLLAHFSINTPMVSFHKFNEKEQSIVLADKLAAGRSVALVSDAGTPLVSDPGFLLVSLAKERKLTVVPVPGVSAITCALSVAGLSVDRFTFEGFLPAKPSKRRQQLQTLVNETRTMVFYEAPHRIKESVADITEAFGVDRNMVLARELTKRYETVLSGTGPILLQALNNNENETRGEFVVLVSGNAAVDVNDNEAKVIELLNIMLKELPLKQAVRLCSEITGVRKNQVYNQAIEISQKR